jgi:hypothetical protein
VTGGSIAKSFCRRLIQPIKYRVHPAYEYLGQSDPTHVVNQKVSKEEMATRVLQIYTGKARQEVPEGTLAEAVDRPGESLG